MDWLLELCEVLKYYIKFWDCSIAAYTALQTSLAWLRVAYGKLAHRAVPLAEWEEPRGDDMASTNEKSVQWM